MSIVDFVKGIPPREGSGPSRDDFMSIGGPGGSPRSDDDIQVLIDKALVGLDRPNFRDDFMSIDRRLDELSNRPRFNPSDMQSQLAGLQDQFDTFSAPPPPDHRDDFMSIGGPGGGKPDPTGGGSDPTESQLNDFIQQFLEGLFGPSSSPQEAPPMPTPTPMPMPMPMPMPNYQDYSINASPQGYNPYLSGQYQSTPYGNAGVPNMGGITTIPVPASYQAPRTMT